MRAGRHVPEVPAVERRDAPLEALTDDAPTHVSHAVRREAEVLEDRLRRRRRAEMVEPDDRALIADPALPAERDTDLYADTLANVRRQDQIAIRLVLGVELLPAGQ